MPKTKQYKVIISPELNSMLEQHVAFLASQDISAGEQLHNKIIKAIKSLETFPERYPILEYHNLNIEFRKMYVPNWYLLIYEIEQDIVKMQYMIDCRQDYMWLLEEK